jgi:uncharacterized membrane protein
VIVLALGLLLFLGTHSVRLLAGDWRQEQIRRLGAGPWKGLYALVSLAGFVLIVWGFGIARADPAVLWLPPHWTRHLAAALTLPAFVLVLAAYVPGNHLKSWFGHPMLAGVKLWAFAHLLANGNLAHVLLFGAILIWAACAFVAARRRDRIAGVHYPPGRIGPDLAVCIAGAAAWALFAGFGHALLIGVQPFG